MNIKNGLLNFACVIVFFILTGCTTTTNVDYMPTTEAPTERVLDEDFGEGLSFTYVDYADKVLSLSYELKRNEKGDWYLTVGGDNSFTVGTKKIDNYQVDTFFYYLLNETNMKAYKDYQKTDKYIDTDVKWWFEFNARYEKDTISAYGNMMHPSDYDDVRVKITEYLNKMFKDN